MYKKHEIQVSIATQCVDGRTMFYFKISTLSNRYYENGRKFANILYLVGAFFRRIMRKKLLKID